LPGGRTSPESLAQIIDTVFSKGLEPGERIDSIKASFGSLSESMTIEIAISGPAYKEPQDSRSRDAVDERRM
jgi:hypothetical protein